MMPGAVWGMDSGHASATQLVPMQEMGGGGALSKALISAQAPKSGGLVGFALDAAAFTAVGWTGAAAASAGPSSPVALFVASAAGGSGKCMPGCSSGCSSGC